MYNLASGMMGGFMFAWGVNQLKVMRRVNKSNKKRNELIKKYEKLVENKKLTEENLKVVKYNLKRNLCALDKIDCCIDLLAIEIIYWRLIFIKSYPFSIREMSDYEIYDIEDIIWDYAEDNDMLDNFFTEVSIKYMLRYNKKIINKAIK